MNTQFRITDPDELEARGKCLDNCDEQVPVLQTDEDYYELISCYVSCCQVADEFNDSSTKVATSSRFGGTIGASCENICKVQYFGNPESIKSCIYKLCFNEVSTGEKNPTKVTTSNIADDDGGLGGLSCKEICNFDPICIGIACPGEVSTSEKSGLRGTRRISWKQSVPHQAALFDI
jgi:hypothetical protein